MLLRTLTCVLVYLYLNIQNTSCDDGITIAFAIDDTRSMWDDIDQVKREAKNILDVAIAEKSSEIKDLVLVTINDPDVVLRTKTSSTFTLQQSLNNIRVHNHANYDCEEMSLTGIEKALQASRPNSYIFVFTDAAAKDYQKLETIKYLCQKKQSQVIFVLTGDCGYPSHKSYMVYHEIAATSSGQVFRVKKEQVHSVLDAIRELLKRKHTVVKWTTIPKTPTFVPVMFTLDEKAEYALVSSSGKNVYLRVTSTNHVYGPEPAYEKVMWNSNGKVMKLVNPKPGTYYAWVKGDSALSVVIYARTDFTFDHGFSTNEPKSLKDTTKQPVATKPQHLSINVTDPENSVDIKSVHILDMEHDDQIIKKLPLRKTGDHLYITDAFVSPSRMFRIAVNGVIKKTGQPITRISKTAIEPMENVPDVVINEGGELTVNYGASASLTCKATAHPKPTIEWSTSGGNTLSSETYVIEESSYGSRLKLENIKKTKTYICKAENNKGIGSSQTQITVRPPFNIISVPTATTSAIYGNDVKLQCNIQSHLPIKIRWYHLGKELSNTGKTSISADGTELIVKALDLGLQGTYTCEASLISEPTMKETHHTEVKLTGLEHPVIAPTNKKIEVWKGNKIELNCKIAKGHPAPQVQWYKKNGNDFEAIPHMTGEVLTVPNALLKHAGDYKCIAKNAVGSESAVFDVTIYSPPEITIPETQRSFPYGSNVEFTCKVESNPPPTIVWMDEKGTILEDKKITKIGTYEYANKLKLQFVKKSGAYACKATVPSPGGSNFEIINITVSSPFDVQKHINGEKEVNYGTEETLHCDIKSSQPMSIQWYLQKTDAGSSKTLIQPSDKNTTISSDGTELKIKFMDLNMVGKYTCEATLKNDPGEKINFDTNVKIIGLIKPVIAPSNKNIQIKKGDRLELSCKIGEGYPKPQVQWYKKIGNDLNNFFTIPLREPTEVLTVSRTLFKHAGEYKCIAENAAGSESAMFEVTMTGKPEITIHETKRIFPYGSNVEFNCKVESIPPPTIVWKNDKGNVLESKVTKTADYKFTNQLKLQNVKKSAVYTCEATNSVGDITEYVKITITSPFDVKTQIDGDTEMNYGTENVLRCDIKSSHPMSIQWYLQENNMKSSRKLIQSSDKTTISSDGTELKIKFMDLTMVGKYTCEASLKNDPEEKIAFNTNVKIGGLVKPVIITHNTILKDKDFTAICRVKGVPMPTISWQFKQKGSDVFTGIPGSEEELKISQLGLKHSGVYKCVAKNVLGDAEHDFDLVVEERPVITNTNTTYFGIEGDLVLTIPCNVTGFPDPEIVWKTEGKIIDKNSKYATKENVLYINKPVQKDSKQFTCEAKNKLGTTEKLFYAEITDTFENDKNYYGINHEIYAIQGKPISIKCNIITPDTRSVRWYRNGQLEPDQTGNSYIIKIGSVSDDGNYTCRVNTDKGSQSETFALDVGYLNFESNSPSPKIIDWKDIDEVLDCSVQAKPSATVEWIKDGKKVENLNDLQNVPVTDWGQYTCNVTNKHGSIQKTFKVISSGCFIIKSMGTQNMPLISSVSTVTWPNSLSNLDLSLQRHETVKFSCQTDIKSSNEFEALPGKKEIIAHCHKQDQFIVDGKTYRYSELQCKTKVESLVLNTLEQCAHANTELIRIGFEVNGLLEAYIICYDKIKNVPVYVKGPRPPLFAGDVDSSKFKWTSVPGLSDGKPAGGYTCTSSNECCYGKGQLANATELPFGPAQDAAFKENLNSVAIWRPCAGSDRKSWDSFVNEMLFKSIEFEQWTSWTGASDYVSKNGGLVPRYLWKVIHHDEDISVMVYVNDEAPTDSDIRCTQICESMLTSASQKFLYCCTPEEFSTAFNIDIKLLK